MHKTFILLSLLILSTFALPATLEDLKLLWSSWKQRYSKGYGKVEEARRFKVFLDNVMKIISFNAENERVKLGLNQFADLTKEEFGNLHTNNFFLSSNSEKAGVKKYQRTGDLPEKVDWREEGAVTPVFNQGQCGSSWATPITGTLEGLLKIKTGELKALSVQQLLECDNASFGCSGGYIDEGFEYTAKYGIETEEDYPYTAQKGIIGQCKYDPSKAIKINSGYEHVKAKSTNALKAALVEQPVATPIEADDTVMQFYKYGVIEKNCKATYINHGVFTVGYRKVAETEAFIVKNTWGKEWGQDGYVYISTDETANNGFGVCGILSLPVVPTA